MARQYAYQTKGKESDWCEPVLCDDEQDAMTRAFATRSDTSVIAVAVLTKREDRGAWVVIYNARRKFNWRA